MSVDLLAALRRRGYDVKINSKGHYFAGIHRRLTAHQLRANVLLQPALLRLLSNAQVRKGRAYTLTEMLPIALPADAAESAQFAECITQLQDASLFLRGIRAKCEVCHLNHWYALDELPQQLNCLGCGEYLKLPLDMQFAYRANPLLCEGLKSGLLSVFAVMQQKCYGHYWDGANVCVDIRKDDIISDIDAMYRGCIYECKDNFKTTDAALAGLEAQLSIQKRIADDIGAQLYFATLYQGEIPARLQQFLTAHDITQLPRQELLRSRP